MTSTCCGANEQQCHRAHAREHPGLVRRPVAGHELRQTSAHGDPRQGSAAGQLGVRRKKGCNNGALTVGEATDSRLTMRFTPTEPARCNTWTVVLTHVSGGGLSMAVDPDSNRYHETEFVVRMAGRSGCFGRWCRAGGARGDVGTGIDLTDKNAHPAMTRQPYVEAG